MAIQDKANGTNFVVQLTNSLSKITGLFVSTEVRNGRTYLSYAKDANQETMIQTDKNGKAMGSELARSILMDIIDDDVNVVKITQSSSGSRGGTIKGEHQIALDGNQIKGFIKGVRGGLNSETLGFGMTFLHEFSHTDLGGALSDKANVTKMNIIRKQLGADYGERKNSNKGTAINGINYMPFDAGSYFYINVDKIAPSPWQKHIQY